VFDNLELANVKTIQTALVKKEKINPYFGLMNPWKN